jgi:hypothetical protein
VRKVLSHGSQTVELVRLGEAAPTEAMTFSSRASAAAFLRGFSRDPLGMTTLRRALAEEIGRQRVGRLCDAEVVDQLAAQIAHGRLRVARHSAARAVLRPPPVQAWQGAKPREEEPVVLESTGPPPAPAAETGSWIKLEVVDDATGEPVAGVTFTLKLPDGTSKDVTTNPGGIAELTGLTPGSFDIEKMADGEAWEVVAIA